MLSVKQSGTKYHFLSICYDSTWDWTQVSPEIGEYIYRYFLNSKNLNPALFGIVVLQK